MGSLSLQAKTCEGEMTASQSVQVTHKRICLGLGRLQRFKCRVQGGLREQGVETRLLMAKILEGQ